MKDGENVDILITGAHGQLGKELERRLTPFHSVSSLGKNELDITNKEKVDKMIAQINPQIIIHSAAYTAVDQCEIERKKAFEVNGFGAGYVAQAANKANARMFYISSDYVFDGNKHTPYVEEDKPNPISVYGRSKWLGEEFVLKINQGTVIRTSWLYGHDGKNFVKTMLALAKKNKEIHVINDQIGSPTYVKDLTDIFIQLLSKKNGIYHASNSGSCSWYEFAKAIFKEAGYNPEHVIPTTTMEYGSLAPRPHYSVLKNTSLIRESIEPLRPWDEALKEFIRKEISQ
jgi:dTDP-4-dehydrorhamnose reductase